MSCSSQHPGPKQELRNGLSESLCHAPPSRAPDQVPSESPCAWQWASSVLCRLNLPHSLCVMEQIQLEKPLLSTRESSHGLLFLCWGSSELYYDFM